MQNKNPANRNWKDILEDISTGESGGLLNTNTAWDKLYNRLHQPRRRKTGWYWLAAACFVTAVISLMFFLQYSGHNTVSVPVSKGEDKIMPVISPEKLPLPVISVPIKNETVKVNAQQVNKKTTKKDDNVVLETTITVTVADNTNTEPVVEAPGVKDTSVAVIQVVSIQPKTKLKVTHVNELGDRAEDKYYRKPVTDYSVIKFGFKSQQSYSNPAVPSNRVGVNISTSKTSPSN